jgi:hypothetical protein
VAGAEPAPAGDVAALGRELERISRRVSRIDEQVREISEQIAAIPAPPSPAPAPSVDVDEVEPLPSWLLLTSWHNAHALMESLRVWVAQVYLRYPNTQLATCWAWHPDVVEELWWLQNTWSEAYFGPKPSWQKAGDWHDRQRPGVTRRINDTIGSCGLDRHQGRGAQTAPHVPLEDGLPHVVTAWATPSHADWPPEPTAPLLVEAQRHDDETTKRTRSTR